MNTGYNTLFIWHVHLRHND